VARVAALDIAKASAMLCTRVPGTGVRKRQEIRKTGATTAAILELADHLVCQGIELVVMEATSDYWRPFYYLLEDRGLECWLVNAPDVKNVPPGDHSLPAQGMQPAT
jgi:transposase